MHFLKQEMLKVLFFLYIQIAAQEQPDAWPDYTGSYGLYGVWSRTADVQWSDFVQFYHKYDATKVNPQKVMSRRINGVYVTALWDKPGVQIRIANSQFCEFVRSESEFASHRFALRDLISLSLRFAEIFLFSLSHSANQCEKN